MDIARLLSAAAQLGASDIHFAADSPPLVRVNGDLVALPGQARLNADQCKALVYSALSEAQRAAFEADQELDCSFQVAGLNRYRMNVLMQLGRVEAALRVIPLAIPAAEELGLGPTMMGLADLAHGLLLVTGPTGSGKTTTLACLIDHINRKSRKHIITIEDPVEHVFPRRLGLVRQREVGSDTRSFAQALKHALRQDPDVILVGEMRDLETIGLTLTAAETGHLVLSTLHTIDAPQTINRVIDVFPAAQQPQIRAQLANVLRGVVSQVLVPRADGKGRIAARGLMLVNPAIANLIRETKTHMIENAIDTSAALGMYTVQRALDELLRRGLVELDAAQAAGWEARRRERASAGASS